MASALGTIAVVDLTTARSGPTCTRILGDSDADVVRVERLRDAGRPTSTSSR